MLLWKLYYLVFHTRWRDKVRGPSTSENLEKPKIDIGLSGAEWVLTVAQGP